jgi:hypothetical protein
MADRGSTSGLRAWQAVLCQCAGVNAPHNIPEFAAVHESVHGPIATNFALGPDVSFRGKAEVPFTEVAQFGL